MGMSISTYIIRILAGALAYYALGRIGLLLTLPPGYATIFWPPAGLALAGVLLYGKHIWPAIFLGAIGTTLSHGDTSQAAVLLAIGVAIGAVLQAMIGGAFIRNYLPRAITLERLREIILVLFLGGVLACSINASIGNGLLYAAEIIPKNDFTRNWLTWYVGDVVGVFLFCPFTLLLLAPFSEVSLRRKVVVCSSLAATLLLFGCIFSLLKEWETQKEKNEFDAKAISISQELKNKLNQYPKILKSIEDLFAASDEVTFKEFDTFTARFFEGSPHIQLLTWNQKVTAAERATFVESIRLQGFPDFQIMQSDEEGQIVPASDQPVYFPVTYMTPYQTRLIRHGFDLYSNDPEQGGLHRTALESAQNEGISLLTNPQAKLQSAPYHLVLYSPIYDTDSSALSSPLAQKKLRGLDRKSVV